MGENERGLYGGERLQQGGQRVSRPVEDEVCADQTVGDTTARRGLASHIGIK